MPADDRSSPKGNGQTIPITVPDGTFDGWLVAPTAANGHGLVILQEIFGVTQKIRGYCDLFAGAGYTTLAPDLFWRIEPGVQLSHEPDDIARAMALLGRLDQDRALGDVKAAADELRARGIHSVGIVGFCLGGRLAPLSLLRQAGDAAVSFYGVDLDQQEAELGQVTQPMQLHFGEQDAYIPPAAIAKVEAALRGKTVELFRYPDGGHAFFRASLKDPASRLAFDRTVAFLRRTLGS